jgi:hypothetical protein
MLLDVIQNADTAAFCNGLQEVLERVPVSLMGMALVMADIHLECATQKGVSTKDWLLLRHQIDIAAVKAAELSEEDEPVKEEKDG